MAAKLSIIEEAKKKILPILKNYRVTKAGIFGSFSRGDMKKDSDIDLLVEIKERISFLDFVGLKLDLEDAVGRKVDLVEYSVIKPSLRKRILSEEIQII
jgi:uncharacterized protein